MRAHVHIISASPSVEYCGAGTTANLPREDSLAVVRGFKMATTSRRLGNGGTIYPLPVPCECVRLGARATCAGSPAATLVASLREGSLGHILLRLAAAGHRRRRPASPGDGVPSANDPEPARRDARSRCRGPGFDRV